MSDYLERTKNGMVFVGSDQKIFWMFSLAKALKLYAEAGIQINRAYTPTAMLKAAKSYTGTTYKRGAYMEAHNDLCAKAELMKTLPRVEWDDLGHKVEA